MNGDRVTYSTDSSSVSTDPNIFVTKPFKYYLYQIDACLYEYKLVD